MKIYLCIVLIALNMLTCFSRTAEDKCTITALLDSENPALLSKFWPDFVKINEDYISEDLSIRKDKRGVLVRVLESGAMIDFGREGIHIVKVENTNLIEMMKVSINSGVFQNFNRRLNRQIFIIDTGEFREIVNADVDGNYKLIYFTNFEDSKSVRKIKELSRQKDVLKNYSLDIMLCSYGVDRTTYIKMLKDIEWNSPAIHPLQSKSFAHYINIGDINEDKAILIDASGRLLAILKTKEIKKNKLKTVLALDAEEQRKAYEIFNKYIH